MPKGMLDAIKPFLDYHEEINGVDFRWDTLLCSLVQAKLARHGKTGYWVYSF
jgi:hypothetical protein